MQLRSLPPQPRKLQQIFYETRHVGGRRTDAIQVVPCFFRKLRSVFLLENARKTIHVPQRRSQIVRNGIGKGLQFAICFLEFSGSLLYAFFHILLSGFI